MGISVFSNSGEQNYGIKHYILDTVIELNKLPISCSPGSTAFIIENSKTYMLNTKQQWKEIIVNNSIT